MNFNNASEIESIVWQFRQADYIRGLNRSKINDLLNGEAPYTAEEVKATGIVVNHNDLTSTKIAHDARQQMYSAILKPGKYFTATTDWGPAHNRQKFSTIVTRNVNKPMKRSRVYYETQRSKFALLIAQGIAPSAWENKDAWCNKALGIEDVFIPSNTTLTMDSLDKFCIHRSYTAPQLIKLTRGPRNPGWNMPMVESLLKWIDNEATALMGTSWPEVWAPEKVAERLKGDGAVYACDAIPTIEVFDFYFWNDSDGVDGWNRRIIMDAWSTPGADGAWARSDKMDFSKNQFLFNPGKRKYAMNLDELIAFQYADLSAVAPFRYHSVRSLGWLLYGICHLQNRLHCKFNEAVFENLMMYLRVKSLDDAERALKIEFANRGIIDESVSFLRPEERWQVNERLAQMGLQHNAQLIESNTSSWRQQQDFSRDSVEKTKFQVMAEVNASTMLINAALLQAYQYQTFEYREIFRRFMRKNSNDPDVRTFRNRCLKEGVPEKLMVPEAWEIEPERVMGGGNKTQAMAEAQQLMQFRPLYDPEPQRKILRDVTLAITDDPGRAEELVPETPVVSNTIHDTELVFNALMSGTEITPKGVVNNIEVIAVMLKKMERKINEILQSGGVGTPQDVRGLTLSAQYTGYYLKELSKDPEQKDKVTSASKHLAKLMNYVKAMAQRQQEMAQKAAQQNGNGQDPELQAKLQSQVIQAKAKADNSRESNAQKTAQRQVSFEQKQAHDEQKHMMEMKRQAQELELDSARTQMELAADAAKTHLEIQKQAATPKRESPASE